MDQLETQQVDLEEKKLNRLATGGLCLQGVLVATLSFLNFFAMPHGKEAAKALPIVAIIVTAILSRFYIRQGKKVEALKTFSDQEASARMREYASLFPCAYFMWALCFIMISR